MKKICFLLFAIFIICIANRVHAQSQFTGWLASFNTFKTGKKTSIHADVQLRSSDELKRMQTILVRTGLNVHLSKQLIVTAGYAFIDNYRTVSNVSGYAPEHRIWEQLLYNHKLNRVMLSHRFRVEQRFISKSVAINNELKNDGSLYANRFRYFLRNVIPFTKEPVFQKGMFAALQDEVFLNFGNNTNVNGKSFDQNRLYLAVGYRLKKSFDLEAGYMNQYISGRNSAFTNNHIVQLAAYLRL